jgi:hypothetical protein
MKKLLDEIGKQQCIPDQSLKLIVFPANAMSVTSENRKDVIQKIKCLATEFNVDLVIGVKVVDGSRSLSENYLVTKEQKTFCYKRLHKFSDEDSEIGDHFLVVDRDYGRLAILQDIDLLVPETTKVLGKMGVDLVAVVSDEDDKLMRTLCTARSSEYLHFLMSNKRGHCGCYAGGFKSVIPFQEDKRCVLIELDIEHVREKKGLSISMNPELILRKAG